MNTSLQELCDRHEKQKAYICGSGHSLRHVKESDLQDGIIFCVNDACLKFSRFHYFVYTDGSLDRFKYFRELKEKCCEVICANPEMGDSLRLIGLPDDMLHHLPRKWGMSELDQDRMSREDEKLIVGADALQVALHLAYVMGCEPLILHGADCCYKSNKKYFHEFFGQPECITTMTDAHRKEGYRASIGIDGALEYSLNYWKKIANLNPHVKILNASKDTAIPCFEKI